MPAILTKPVLSATAQQESQRAHIERINRLSQNTGIVYRAGKSGVLQPFSTATALKSGKYSERATGSDSADHLWYLRSLANYTSVSNYLADLTVGERQTLNRIVSRWLNVNTDDRGDILSTRKVAVKREGLSQQTAYLYSDIERITQADTVTL